MASKEKKTAKSIDYSAPVKKSKLSIDYMMGYISAKAPDYKEEFKSFAVLKVLDNGKIDIKAVREEFVKKFPETVIQPKAKSYKTALDKLKEWWSQIAPAEVGAFYLPF